MFWLVEQGDRCKTLVIASAAKQSQAFKRNIETRLLPPAQGRGRNDKNMAVF
jgi:hypothetical protein